MFERDENDRPTIGMYFQYSEDGKTCTFHRYCHSVTEAELVVEGLQSLAGNNLERDGDFVYVVVDSWQVREAKEELRSCNFGFMEAQQ